MVFFPAVALDLFASLLVAVINKRASRWQQTTEQPNVRDCGICSKSRRSSPFLHLRGGGHFATCRGLKMTTQQLLRAQVTTRHQNVQSDISEQFEMKSSE